MRFAGRAKINGEIYRTVWEARRKAVILVSMFVER